MPRLGAIRVDDRLSVDVIRTAVEGQRDALRACYLAALQTNPTLTGRVAVKLTVDIRGGVGETCAEVDLPDERAVRCIEEVFARMVFPAPAGGVAAVKVPLMFTPPS